MHLSESDGQQQHLRSRVAQLENSVTGLETQLESARLAEAELQLQLEGARAEASTQLRIHQTASTTSAVTGGAASEAPETVVPVRLNQYLFTEVAQLRQTYPLPALDIYVNSTLELSGPST